MDKAFEDLKIELEDKEKTEEKIKETFDKVFAIWGKRIKGGMLSELNLLEQLSEITGDHDNQTKILDAFVGYMQTENIDLFLLERTLADKYLEEADRDLTALSLYRLDYMHQFFKKIKDKKKLEELDLVFKRISGELLESWGLK